MPRALPYLALASLLWLPFASGCASSRIAADEEVYDPLQPVNRAMYSFNDGLDKVLLKPAAQAYQTVTPEIVDTGISNFFSNLDDVVVLANDILQLKFEQSLSDASRIVFNSTFGLGGLIDVASHMDLPKHNEDFGQTLGYWGLGGGPYLVLPVFGPSNLRDGLGLAVDMQTNPLSQLSPESHQYALTGLNIVDTRADLLRVERALAGSEIDPYISRRDAYLQRRQNLIHDGNPPRPRFEDDAD